MPLTLTYPNDPTNGPYPFATGYADAGSVANRIVSWNPNLPNARPVTADVTSWLIQATALIDAALAVRGYFVPLKVRTGFTLPAGMAGIGGIDKRAYLLLESIAAAFACALVEAARHGSQGVNADDASKYWMTVFDEFLTRLETGADNLGAYGCDGTFAPEIDPAAGLDSGSIGSLLSDSTTSEGPIFTKTQQF